MCWFRKCKQGFRNRTRSKLLSKHVSEKVSGPNVEHYKCLSVVPGRRRRREEEKEEEKKEAEKEDEEKEEEEKEDEEKEEEKEEEEDEEKEKKETQDDAVLTSSSSRVLHPLRTFLATSSPPQTILDILLIKVPGCHGLLDVIRPSLSWSSSSPSSLWGPFPNLLWPPLF
jgi:outer membrane biosynthesis protein TonB